MSLYVVKNDKGEWLYSDEYTDWVDQLSQATFYDTFEDADDDIECWELSNAYVVELAEAPEKVVVSEEEAEMLERAKDSCWPAHIFDCGAAGATINSQDRLIRAYVIGWTVEKPKQWNVKVPLVQAQGGLWFLINASDKLDATYIQDIAKKFSMEEINTWGLQDCEREEVTEDDD